MKNSERTNHEPVTLVFTWQVKKGKEKQFEKWAHETTDAASQFEGHLGANWIKPAPNNTKYTVIYKFDTLNHFRAWEESDKRKKLLKRGLALTTQEKTHKVEELSGLETWFTLPGSLTIKPPPKWKMMLATMIGIYPLGLLLQIIIYPYLGKVPLLLKPVVLAVAITPLMTYVVMPHLTKWFKPWLYPKQ